MVSQIDPFPEPLPNRRNQSNEALSDAVDNLFGALPTRIAQMNAQAAEMSAVLVAAFTGTSASEVTIGAGAKTFDTQQGLALNAGQWVIVASGADPSNYVLGQVTGYDGETGELSLSVLETGIGGAGTYSDWSISLTPAPISRERASTATSFASPLAFNSDLYDGYEAGAQAANLTINADAGTPNSLRKTLFMLTCDGTSRTITFKGGVSKGFKPIGVGFGTSGSDFTYALVPNKTTVFGIVYNEALDRHLIFAFAQEA